MRRINVILTLIVFSIAVSTIKAWQDKDNEPFFNLLTQNVYTNPRDDTKANARVKTDIFQAPSPGWTLYVDSKPEGTYPKNYQELDQHQMKRDKDMENESNTFGTGGYDLGAGSVMMDKDTAQVNTDIFQAPSPGWTLYVDSKPEGTYPKKYQELDQHQMKRDKDMENESNTFGTGGYDLGAGSVMMDKDTAQVNTDIFQAPSPGWTLYVDSKPEGTYPKKYQELDQHQMKKDKDMENESNTFGTGGYDLGAGSVMMDKGTAQVKTDLFQAPSPVWTLYVDSKPEGTYPKNYQELDQHQMKRDKDMENQMFPFGIDGHDFGAGSVRMDKDTLTIDNKTLPVEDKLVVRINYNSAAFGDINGDDINQRDKMKGSPNSHQIRLSNSQIRSSSYAKLYRIVCYFTFFNYFLF